MTTTTENPQAETLTTPTLTVGAINFDAQEPVKLAGFWAAAMGGQIANGDETFVFVAPPPGGTALFFQRADRERPAHNSIHLDLSTPTGNREAEVERLVALGATRLWDNLTEVPWVEWTTMADPEGNYFCVSCPPAGHAGMP